MVQELGVSMKFLVFRYIKDDRDNDLLEEVAVPKDFSSEEEVLEWLPTIEGSYNGTRYLVVATTSWVMATMKENPVTRYAHIDMYDDATTKRKKNQEDRLHRAVKLAEGLPADAKAVKETT